MAAKAMAEPQAPAQGDAELGRELLDFAEQSYRDFSRMRFAEEREWYQNALFYQRRQWLRWDNGQRRWAPMKPDPRRPRPQPVSNYFAMTINTNANQLAANMPRMLVTPLSTSDADQRAADMAQKALPAIDKESGMNVLNPLLALHATLWGMGITKDVYDIGYGSGRVQYPETDRGGGQKAGCRDCDRSYALPRQPNAQGDGDAATYAPAKTCPACGSDNVVLYERPELVTRDVVEFSRGRITTEIRPIFEVFLPRDCQNPNLAKKIVHRYRKGLGDVKRLFGPAAEGVQADSSSDIHEIYLEALRSLVNYSYLPEQAKEECSCTECWFDWDELPKRLQRRIGEVHPDDAEAWQAQGGFVIGAGGKTMQYGANCYGKKPFTFYLWQVDPASVYPKGLGADLVPLQKRLNRIDSLIEMGIMTNAAGKWLWPRTQTNNDPPSGTPDEVIQYDVIGDGKIAPSFVQPSPFHASVIETRNSILQDFQELGLALPVSRGDDPGSAKAFRALAYLGAKADEQLNTPRFLYELGHQLRYEKCLGLARRFWDEPRLAKVAGPNGKYLVQQFAREDLEGNYDIEVVPGTSRPRTLQDKQAAFAGLLQAGMVDPKDPTVRDYVADMANLERVNLVDHLQYLAAERALERAKQGFAPPANPFYSAEVFFRVFSDFTLREEFETLPPAGQQAIAMAALHWQAQMASAPAPMKPPQEKIDFKNLPPAGQEQMAAQAGIHLAAAMAAPANPLQAVPGANSTPGAAQNAALAQAGQVAQHLA